MGMLVSPVLHDLMVEGPKWSGLGFDYDQAKLPISVGGFHTFKSHTMACLPGTKKKLKRMGSTHTSCTQAHGTFVLETKSLVSSMAPRYRGFKFTIPKPMGPMFTVPKFL